MPYASGRIIHDADSHLMELPDVLDKYLDPKFRSAYDALPKLAKREEGYAAKARANHADPAFRESGEANIMLRKNYDAMGAFLRGRSSISSASPASSFSRPGVSTISGSTGPIRPSSPMRQQPRTTG